MEREFQIFLNSKNCDYKNVNLGEYLWDIPDLCATQQNHIYLSIECAMFPYSFYMVNDYNNLLQIYTNGATYSFLLTNGNYNAINLASTLQAIINTTLSDFTISYSAITSKYTFSYTQPFYFKSISTMLNILGFDEYTDTIYSTNITSSQPINLCPSKNIYITLPEIETNNYISNDKNNFTTLCSLQITSQPKSIIIYQSTNNFMINTELFDLRRLKIRLTNENFLPINLNNHNFTLTLNIKIVNFVI